ncbi:hypothetical protein PTMSG1_07830 [Pyrenophora teres f. maculata]|nr:hypothetical protein PTMSG1_07830 [Pyrenophora teres f. maculata]
MAYMKFDPKPATKKAIGPKSKVTKKPWTYKKYQNGKLDLMKAPARFKVLMTLNATQSPLLSLPSEIRNKIFEYALGGYDIYISAYNAQTMCSYKLTARGDVYCKNIQLSYRMVTIMLPQGTPFRSALPTDTHPALRLPQVCRQLYAETGILPYTLNHFKFCDSANLLKKNVGKYANWNQYSALDLWLEQRLPVQIRAIAWLAPMTHYIERYYWKKRPAFTSVFPGLKVLDLRLQIRQAEEAEDEKWRKEARKKDVEGGFQVLFPEVTTRDIWKYSRGSVRDFDMDRKMGAGPCHYQAEVKAQLE